MGTIKVVTDFGIQEVKPTRKKEIRGEMWAVALVPVRYMHREDPLLIRYAIHVKTGKIIPLTNINHTATVKEYFTRVEALLMQMTDADIKKELAKFETIN